jgi:hypothetical protein
MKYARRYTNPIYIELPILASSFIQIQVTCKERTDRNYVDKRMYPYNNEKEPTNTKLLFK